MKIKKDFIEKLLSNSTGQLLTRNWLYWYTRFEDGDTFYFLVKRAPTSISFISPDGKAKVRESEIEIIGLYNFFGDKV